MRFKLLLGFVFAFFMVLMVAVWILAKRANPILLDQQGRPVASSTRTHH